MARPKCARCDRFLVRHCPDSNTTCSWHKCPSCHLVLDLRMKRGYDEKTGHPLTDTGAERPKPGPPTKGQGPKPGP